MQLVHSFHLGRDSAAAQWVDIRQTGYSDVWPLTASSRLFAPVDNELEVVILVSQFCSVIRSSDAPHQSQSSIRTHVHTLTQL